MPSESVYLPDEQADAVREAVDSGEYENTSKAVQAAVADYFEVQA